MKRGIKRYKVIEMQGSIATYQDNEKGSLVFYEDHLKELRERNKLAFLAGVKMGTNQSVIQIAQSPAGKRYLKSLLEVTLAESEKAP